MQIGPEEKGEKDEGKRRRKVLRRVMKGKNIQAPFILDSALFAFPSRQQQRRRCRRRNEPPGGLDPKIS